MFAGTRCEDIDVADIRETRGISDREEDKQELSSLLHPIPLPRSVNTRGNVICLRFNR